VLSSARQNALKFAHFNGKFGEF